MKVIVEIEGRECRYVSRQVVVDLPDGTTRDEVNQLSVTLICGQIEDGDWDFVDSDGVDPNDVRFVAEADEWQVPDCKLSKQEDGTFSPVD